MPSTRYQRCALVNQTPARFQNQETGQCLLEATCCLTGSHKAHRTHYCLFQALSSAVTGLFDLALDAKLSKFLLLCRLFSRVSWLLSGAAANLASKPVSLAETGFIQRKAFSAISFQTNPYPPLHILHPIQITQFTQPCRNGEIPFRTLVTEILNC